MEKCIDFNDITLDLKASVSGAGRSLKEHLLMAEMEDNVMPYSVGALTGISGNSTRNWQSWQTAGPKITLTPHLLPSTRGIVHDLLT